MALIKVSDAIDIVTNLKNMGFDYVSYGDLFAYILDKGNAVPSDIAESAKSLSELTYRTVGKLENSARASEEFSNYLKIYLSGHMYKDQGEPDEYMNIQYENADRIYKKARTALMKEWCPMISELTFKSKVGSIYIYEFKTSDNDFIRLFKDSRDGVIKTSAVYLSNELNRLFDVSIDNSLGSYVPIVKMKMAFAASEIDTVKEYLDRVKLLCEEVSEMIKYVLRDKGENENAWSIKAEYQH